MRRISVSTSPTFTGQVREVFHQATPTQGQRLAAPISNGPTTSRLHYYAGHYSGVRYLAPATAE